MIFIPDVSVAANIKVSSQENNLKVNRPADKIPGPMYGAFALILQEKLPLRVLWKIFLKRYIL